MRPSTRSLPLGAALAVVVLLLALFSGAAQAQETPPSVSLALSPSGTVELGTAVTVTMSFGGLQADGNVNTIDYIYRADVLDSDNADADACENQAGGFGLGVDRNIRQVDQDPEVRTGATTADCPAGVYTIKAVVKSAANVELASASVALTIEGPPDATLSALAVSAGTLHGFPDSRPFVVGVASSVTSIDVTPTANDAGAAITVAVGSATPTTVTSGSAHTVSPLAEGRNTVTVVVTASDGNTTETYTIYVERGVDTDYGWKAADDLNGLYAAGNDNPSGIWSNGTTMWVADSADDKLYAYALSGGARQDGTGGATDLEFALADSSANPTTDDNGDPSGLWSNGTTMWVADSADGKVYAYALSDGTRQDGAGGTTDLELDLHSDNGSPSGIWSNGLNIWVADSADDKLYAYSLSGRTRKAHLDFDLHADNANPAGIWSDGLNIWVADSADGKLYAYKSTGGSDFGTRDSARDFTLTPNNDGPRGLWSDGDTMWVSNDGSDEGDKVFSYNMPPSSNARLSGVAFSGDHDFDAGDFGPDTDLYLVGFANATASTTVTATPSDAGATVAITMRNDVASQTETPVTANTVALETHKLTIITITVTAEDGVATRQYKFYAGRESTAAKEWKVVEDFNWFDHGGVYPAGVWSDGATMWVADSQSDRIYSYRMSDKRRDSIQILLNANTDVAAADLEPAAIWSDKTHIWVLNTPSGGSPKVFAYRLADGAYDRTRNITVDAANDDPGGLWSDGETLWVSNGTLAIDSNFDAAKLKAFAYDLDTGARLADRDIPYGTKPGRIGGMWSDGATAWFPRLYSPLLDQLQGIPPTVEIFAVDLDDNSVDEDRSLLALGHVNDQMRGLWSDGDTLWVGTNGGHLFSGHGSPVIAKVFSYNLPQASDARLKSLALTEPATDLNVDFDPAVTAYTATVAADVGKVAVEAEPRHAEASQVPMVGTTRYDDGVVTLGAAGTDTVIAVLVTAEDGTTKTYSVTATRQAPAPRQQATGSVTVDWNAATRDITVSWTDADACTSPTKYFIYMSLQGTDSKLHERPATDSSHSWNITVITQDFTIKVYCGDATGSPAGRLVGEVTIDHDASGIYPPSADATLSALSLTHSDPEETGTLRPAFAGATTRYRVAVQNSVSRVTFTETLSNASAGAEYLNALDEALADADGAAGHQVEVRVGVTTVKIKVTAEDAQTSETYTVAVERDSDRIWGWTPTMDVNTLVAAGNENIGGVWGDANTLWISDWADGKLYAYNKSTGARDADKDKPLDSANSAAFGIWVVGTILYVANQSAGSSLYAYTFSNMTRLPPQDITLDANNTTPRDIYSDGTTMWVVDGTDDKAYAYNISGRSRDMDQDITFGSNNISGTGIWGQGTTIWVFDSIVRIAFAYKKSDLSRDPQRDFPLYQISSNNVAAAWSDGTTVWTPAITAKKVFTYNTAPAAAGAATLTTLSIDPGTLQPSFAFDLFEYEAVVASSVSRITVTATPNTGGATVTFLDDGGATLTDVDTLTTGVQLDLAEGANIINVKVASGGKSLIYSMVINRDSTAPFGRTASKDVSLTENSRPRGLWGNATHLYVADPTHDKILAYNKSTLVSDSGKTITLDSVNGEAWGIWSNGTTIWVADSTDQKIYAYTLADAMRDTSQEFDITHKSDILDKHMDLWSDETTMWVSSLLYDRNNSQYVGASKLYAYKLTDDNPDPNVSTVGDRDAAKDITLTSDNTVPRGIWSDGTLMWVLDRIDRKLYAYDLANGANIPAADFSQSADNLSGLPIWADGTTMWVLDAAVYKLIAYNMPRLPKPTLTNLTVSPGTLTPAFASATTEYTVPDLAYGDHRITVNATGASGVTVSFLDGDDMTLADADSVATGHQVDLDPGDNTVKVRATKGTATQDYTLTITRAKPRVSIAASANRVDEGGALEFTVRRTPAAGDNLVVTLNVTETGDALDASLEGERTVTIPANATSETLTLQTTGDDDWEPDSRVTVTIVAKDHYTVAPAATAATVGVLSDDFPDATVALEAVGGTNISEGENGDIRITVTTDRDEEPQVDGGTVTVRTGGGTASAGTDYHALDETITVDDADFVQVDTGGGVMRWRASYTRTLRTIEDTEGEGSETVMVAATEVEDQLAVSPTQGSLTYTILDDEPALSIEDQSADEGSNLEFTVTLSPASAQTVTVSYTTTVESGQTATEGTDYTDATGSLSFSPGETTKTITVQTTDDTTNETDETFTVTLNNASNAYIGDATATGTIRASDQTGPNVSIVAGAATAGPWVRDPGLSDARRRAESGVELVQSGGRFPAPRVRASGGGRLVCDCGGHVLVAGAGERASPGDQRGVRRA